MSRLFTSFAISPDQVALAFPLVRAAIPVVDLEAWQDFVRAGADGSNDAAGQALGLRNEGGQVCGLIVYRTQRDLRRGKTLVIDLFVAVDFVRQGPVTRALLQAAETKARELGCYAVQIRLNADWETLTEHIRHQGYGTDAQLLGKPLEPLPSLH